MQVYVINALNELSDEEFENSLSKVEPEHKDRIMRFHFIEDKKRALAGILLSEYAIGEAFGIQKDEIRFEKNKYGKPHVIGKSGVHFNISHSGNYVVCAVGSSPVGIDVQEHKSGGLDIADRFFSKEEKDALKRASDSNDEKQKLFYDMWSLKESYIKCIGMGLSKPLDEFGIVKKDGEYKLCENGEESGEYHFMRYEFAGDYSLCVCSKETGIPDEYTVVSYEEIAGYSKLH
ncbi:4'-phosphopantetheinyl transferase family protein [Butyrivibrio sp. M55]|uniref:4'-phosphopantetheinyl transferase family protein n=1 Tax=Butyrivibrio sp. M55 TaxID=1855323 RepID=UPI0008E7BC50|nr:4'-phosphopantetheinyl transferase superfamily protein [Butyrivibrio sp. M55]SFU45465.1 4'-phosphopantetheinyl transferase [Butyrivibrio sp. M55]